MEKRDVCPFMDQCKITIEEHRCYDPKKYINCIIYNRYKILGYDPNTLAPEVENIGLLRHIQEKN